MSIEDARRVEPTVRAPDALALEEMKNNHAAGMHKMQRGLVGLVVGTGPEKAGNVATLAIVASFALVMISFFKFDFGTQFDLFYKILTTMLGPVGLALGYLFGSKETK
ncbi:hypothetical protein QM996_17920 [Sinorhizobium chiapasense]